MEAVISEGGRKRGVCIQELAHAVRLSERSRHEDAELFVDREALRLFPIVAVQVL